MAAETIQEFLVGLSWKLDEGSQRRFTNALVDTRKAALALATSLTGIVYTIAKVAESYEQLLYQSERVGSAVQSIQALRYELSQVGGSAAGASSALEAIGNFLRNNPGGESFFARLGIQTRDVNGGLRDTADLLREFGQVARTMPSYRATAYANVLGIDQVTLQALMRDTGAFGRQLSAMYRAAGIDGKAAAAGSAVFMQQLRGLGAAVQVLRDKVALSLERGVGGDVDRLRVLLVANFGRISAAIEGVAKIVLWLAWELIRLTISGADSVGRLLDWFNGLDAGTRRWAEGIGLVTAAWWLLNRGFLASPIGRIFELATALYLLWQDYDTFQKGGKSLIDWKQWEPGIDAATGAIHDFETLLKDLWPRVRPYLMPMLGFFKHEFIDAFTTTAKVLGDLFRAMDDAVKGNWVAAGKDLHQALADTQASGREGQQAAAKLASAENAASGEVLAAAGNRLLDHSAMDDATGITGDHVNGLTRTWRYLTGQTSRAEGTGFNILTALGLDRVHAIAMLGNFRQESDLDPDARNGHHYGIEQWSDDRADYIKAQTGIDVKTAGYADQLKAAVWEITGGREHGNAKAFFGATDLSSATGLFDNSIERSNEHPGMPGFDARIAYAHQADQRLRFAGGGTGSGTGKTINATTNASIVVNGAANPEATARAVLRHQTAATDATIRNMKPLIQ